MPTGRADVYTVASGAGVYAGIASRRPAWRNGAVARRWMTIAGTSARDAGIKINSYSGAAYVVRAGFEGFVIGPVHGHSDGIDNSVWGLNLLNDEPVWELLHAASAGGTIVADAPYGTDGQPTARHGWWNPEYIAQIDRVCQLGSTGLYVNGGGSGKLDAFDIVAKQYDGVVPGSPGTSGSGYADVVADLGGCVDVTTGDWYSVTNERVLRRWKVATLAQDWSFDAAALDISLLPRPLCIDYLRNQIIALGWGNGYTDESASTYGLKFFRITITGEAPAAATMEALTFAPSAARTQFLADKEINAGFVQDVTGDKFYWMGASCTLYEITRAVGNVWTIDYASTTGTPPAAQTGEETGIGIYSRLRMGFDGLIFVPAKAGQNTYHLPLRLS